METYQTHAEAESASKEMSGWADVRILQESEPDITGKQRYYILANSDGSGGVPVGTYCFDEEGYAHRC